MISGLVPFDRTPAMRLEWVGSTDPYELHLLTTGEADFSMFQNI